ncbi:MAG: hypothetical protein E7626_04805 [Ruminococcaceae bacterium]|nr:hypothetical protein [Oscillospiraceae bacterium]
MNENEKSVQEYIDEIARLTAQINEREKRDSEAVIFKELFPDVDSDLIPDSVRQESEEKGIPLFAIYAVYERRKQLAALAAQARNHENSGRSSGPLINSDNFGEALSIEQIRAMSPSQVRHHYKQILKTLSNS